MTQEPMQFEGQDESVRDVLTRLYTDGRAYAEAEVERQKLRAGLVGAGIRDALILGAVGIVLVFASLVACLVGVILVLSPLVGTGWATCIVFGGGVILALILLLLARGRIDRMKKAVTS
ncbi:hypothetical protein [Sphingobium estronivorans]|uniref:hypothetical protein n=1 Tax=Sphingobium estronivorans TaxID=1577690 RepID=UPI001F07DE75|nr:hypothetical protein [Sphingobium estronivorans]